MKKSILFFLCIVFSLQNFAQPLTFEQIRPAPPAPQNIVDFDGVFESSIAFADVDNDNDQDVLITGQDNFNQTIAKLYVNNGSGSFTLVAGTPFDGVRLGSIAFADVDNDNDQDVLITGSDGSNNVNHRIAKLYLNNGSGSFTLVTGTPIDGVSFSSIAFADVDNDTDQDVLITGENSSNQSIAKLYLNNGSGSFTLATGTPFDGVRNGSVAFADVDNDTDQDVLITGENSSNQLIAKLYLNNGSGSFTLVTGTPFDGVQGRSTIAFSDVDNDTDQDVLITGENSSNQSTAKLYLNNGSGSFTLATGTPFDGERNGSVAFADVDNDFDQDVLITGANNSNQQIAKLYLNNGSGSFTLATGTPFDGVRNGSVAFADVDNDNDQDVLITGANNSNQRISKLFVNNGSGSFTLVAGKPFDGVFESSIAFADVDNDNDQDVLITGYYGSLQSIAKLYTNNGNGIYLEVTGTPFDRVDFSSIAFADVDNDNDQDVLITGRKNFGQIGQMIAKLYTNNGSGNFTEVTGTPFDGVYRGSIAFSDVDNDNDQDVLITGINNIGQRIAKLYTNNGSGSFTLVTGTPFDGAYGGSIAFADVDNDNDQDLLITGRNNTSQAIAKLYTNNGSGSYTEVTGTPFDRVTSSSIAFADVDNDNDQDLLITGQNNTGQRIAKLYTNNGSGSFTLVTGTPFDRVTSSSIAFADVDNDNDQDLLITGQNNTGQRIAKLYTNNGSGSFTLVTGTPFDGASGGSIALADVDNDTDQDVLITGSNNSNQPIAKLYRNLLISPCQNIRDTTIVSICNSYNWQGMILATSGTYYDTIQNASGCDSLMTLKLTIHTNDKSITKENDTLTANQVGAAYQWLNCEGSFIEISGATNQYFSPSINGFYACQIKLNGCTDTTACIEVFIIGIEEKNISESYELYPNPFTDQLIIEAKGIQLTTNIEVLNVNGQLVYAGVNDIDGNAVLNTSDWPKGIYFVRLINKNGVGTFKVVHQ